MRSTLKCRLLAAGITAVMSAAAVAQPPASPLPPPHPPPPPAMSSEGGVELEQFNQAHMQFNESMRRLGVDPAMEKAHRDLVIRPVLGVVLAPDPEAGVQIAAVTPGGAAAAAGLRSGDRLLAVRDTPITAADADARVDEVRKLLTSIKAGQPLSLRYRRDSKTMVASVLPKLDQDVLVFDADDVRTTAKGNVIILRRADGVVDFEADTVDHASANPYIGPIIRREIIKLGPEACTSDDCRLPMLAEAFRWSGLNLASVDAQLGRYFGTDHGVLVLSTPQAMGELQPGDVMMRVAGKEVATPRDAMAAMRSAGSDASVTVEYLRDRKKRSTQVKAPQPRELPLPPAPPAPPAPPLGPHAPPPPSAPPAPLR